MVLAKLSTYILLPSVLDRANRKLGVKLDHYCILVLFFLSFGSCGYRRLESLILGSLWSISIPTLYRSFDLLESLGYISVDRSSCSFVYSLSSSGYNVLSLLDGYLSKGRIDRLIK